jgi:hypothetical protein
MPAVGKQLGALLQMEPQWTELPSQDTGGKRLAHTQTHRPDKIANKQQGATGE